MNPLLDCIGPGSSPTLRQKPNVARVGHPREWRRAMKIGRVSFSGAVVAMIVIQLALVSCFAAEYLYQRWTCPRAWTRAVGADPDVSTHGRYLRLRLMVNGCQSTLPSAKLAAFPRDVNGAVKPGHYVLRPEPQPAYSTLISRWRTTSSWPCEWRARRMRRWERTLPPCREHHATR